jgi:hypothetical protein
MIIPSNLETWTPDEVAECVNGINEETYKELWAVMDNPNFKKRPLGGDGSNGTTEVPDDFSGSLSDAWPLLSAAAKANIFEAGKKMFKEEAF